MAEAFRQRVRLRFAKTGDARFLSHHDLMRAWEMALRRSGLPLRLTEGFNPRIRLSMPLALSLGIASQDEILEIELDGWTPAEGIRDRLAPELSPGLALKDLELLAPGKKGQVAWVEYSARIPDADGERLKALLEKPQVIVERRREESRKDLDIRPFLLEVRREAEEDWRMRLKITPQGTARPDEALRAAGLDGPQVPGLLTKTRTEMEG